MRNIPIFTASNGLATLILREIPYSGRAYALIRSVWNGQTAALLEECRQFCRACGAEEIYASQDLEQLPAEPAYEVLDLHCSREDLPPLETPVELEPLTAENGAAYLEVYNRCFRDVPGAAAYDRKDLERLLQSGLGFLCCRHGVCAAVVELTEDGIAGIAVLPEFRGLGYPLALTALNRVQAPVLRLKTASTNDRALNLYDRLGFRVAGISARWYRI